MIIRMILFPVILLLVLYFVIAKIVPATEAIAAKKTEITAEEDRLVKAQEELKKIEDFQQKIKDHPDEVAYVKDFVPDDQREETLLSDISQIAEGNEIELFSVGFSESGQGTGGGAGTIEVKMIMTGTYDNFKKFAHQLFRLKRLNSFKTFDLTKAEQGEGEDGESSEDAMLSGVMSFSYNYLPGSGQISSASMSKPIDFELISKILQSTSHTEPLKSEPSLRPNPFLP